MSISVGRESKSERGIVRLSKEERKREILNAAIALAKVSGYRTLTRDGVADRALVSTGLISYHFETMDALKRLVVKTAIEKEILPIIAQALADGDLQARNAPERLKKQALATLSQ